MDFIAMWLIAMAAVFVSPAACATGCVHGGTVAVVQVNASAPACHMPPGAAAGAAGSCCPQDTPDTCNLSAPHTANPAVASAEAPAPHFVAVLVPTPAPWAFVAIGATPETPVRLLPPREPLARRTPSRAPPVSFL